MDITERNEKENNKTRLQPGDHKAKIFAKNIIMPDILWKFELCP